MKKLIFLLGCLFIVLGLKAQINTSLAKVTPPSPNAAAFQKYGDIPISPYTGVPEISIPIYTIKNHDITVPISISYHASGIKVADEASQVGLGWTLNAGGVISRNIINKDDFLDPYLNKPLSIHGYIIDLNGGKGLPFTFKSLHMEQENNAFRPVTATNCIVPTFDIHGQNTINNIDLKSALTIFPEEDFQPDQFYYNVGNLSGKFIINRERLAILQKQEKIKIECLDDAASQWQITDLSGVRYLFSVYETSFSIDEPGIKHRTAWYLTKIISPAGNIVKFSYTVAPYQLQALSSYFETREAFASTPSYPLKTVPLRGPESRALLGNLYTPVVLDSIDYDNGRVAFNYSNDRADLPGDRRLANITIFKKDLQNKLIPLKTDEFSYDYLESLPGGFGSSGSMPTKRLKLANLKETGYNKNGTTVSTNPYIFNYNWDQNHRLPSKTSYARDHWGYYNGRDNNTSFIPQFHGSNGSDVYNFYMGYPGNERDADSVRMSYGSLASIIYPTGGSTSFDYEANDFDEQKSIKNDNTRYAKQYTIVPQSSYATYYTDGSQYIGSNKLDMRNEYITSDPATGSKYFIPGTMTATLRLSGDQSNQYPLNWGDVVITLVDSSGNEVAHVDPSSYQVAPLSTGAYTSVSGSIIDVKNLSLNLYPGLYTWQVHIRDNTFTHKIMDVHSIFTWYTQVRSDSSAAANSLAFSPAGGLRVKRITDHDPLGNNPDHVRRFIYRYTVNDKAGHPTEHSYGIRMIKPQYSYWEPSYETFYNNSGESALIGEPVDVMHLRRSSESNINANGSLNGTIVGYSQVTMLDGENGENGRSVMEYHNEPDYVPGYINFFNLEQRSPVNSNVPDPLNGKMVHQLDFANNNGKLTKVKEITNTYANIFSLENAVYGMEVRKIPYGYYQDNQEVSDPSRFSNVGACDDMELYGYKALSSTFNYLFSTNEKEYALNDDTKSTENTKYYFYNNTNHLQPSSIVTYNSKGEKLINNITYPLDYNVSGSTDPLANSIRSLQVKNIIEAPIENSLQLSNVDYSNARTLKSTITKYSTINSEPDTVYQLESSTPLKNYQALHFVNGSAVIDPLIDSLLFYDKFDDHGNVLQEHKTKNGVPVSLLWGYHNEYPIAEVQNATYQDLLGVLGQSAIDDFNLRPATDSIMRSRLQLLRTLLPHSLVTTYTFDPVVGMTSTTDAKGITTYYEYDGLQRLSNIKDKDGNVVKHFCYNYAGQQNGCDLAPPLLQYFNVAQSGIFKPKQLIGYQSSGTFLYSIEAGAFSSLISQASADSLAIKALIISGQENADNKGNKLLYFSSAQSASFTPVCGNGYQSSGTYPFSIAAKADSSIISLADANQKALQRLNTLGQANANSNGCPTVYYNTVQSASFAPQCSGGYQSTGNVPYSIAPGSYSSTISQADANQKAVNALNSAGQANANSQGCTLIYYNTAQSASFAPQCPGGYQSTGSVSYTVAAGTYSSTISQADANQKAANALNSAGQANANSQGCTLIYYNTAQSASFAPQCPGGYQSTGNVSYSIPAGSYSSTISQADANQKAVNALYSAGQTNANSQGCTVIYYNNAQSGSFVPQCQGGYQSTTNSVGYSIPAGVYSSTISQSDADQQAVNALNSAGQANANYDGCALVYYSSASSATFTKNNCPSGQIGSQVIYTVAPETYSSISSQNDADQQALNDVNANGQNYANANGTCQSAPMMNITFQNTTNSGANASFYNVATQVTYSFYLSSNVSNSTVVGQIPEGTYNITLSGAGTHFYRIYNLSRSGVSSLSYPNADMISGRGSLGIN